MHNSNLSLVIENLIKTQTVTLYSKDLNNDLVWDSEYCLFDNIESPLKFTYESEQDIYSLLKIWSKGYPSTYSQFMVKCNINLI